MTLNLWPSHLHLLNAGFVVWGQHSWLILRFQPSACPCLEDNVLTNWAASPPCTLGILPLLSSSFVLVTQHSPVYRCYCRASYSGSFCCKRTHRKEPFCKLKNNFIKQVKKNLPSSSLCFECGVCVCMQMHARAHTHTHTHTHTYSNYNLYDGVQFLFM